MSTDSRVVIQQNPRSLDKRNPMDKLYFDIKPAPRAIQLLRARLNLSLGLARLFTLRPWHSMMRLAVLVSCSTPAPWCGLVRAICRA